MLFFYFKDNSPKGKKKNLVLKMGNIVFHVVKERKKNLVSLHF